MQTSKVIFLKDASKHAQQQSKSQLGAYRFNNYMSLFLNRVLEHDLMGTSHYQNVILLSKPRLTVYVVPWEYALCGKTDPADKTEPTSIRHCRRRRLSLSMCQGEWRTCNSGTAKLRRGYGNTTRWFLPQCWWRLIPCIRPSIVKHGICF